MRLILQQQASFQGIITTSSDCLPDIRKEFTSEIIPLTKPDGKKNASFVINMTTKEMRFSVLEGYGRKVVDFIRAKGYECCYVAKHGINTVEDVKKIVIDDSNKVGSHNIDTVI